MKGSDRRFLFHPSQVLTSDYGYGIQPTTVQLDSKGKFAIPLTGKRRRLPKNLRVGHLEEVEKLSVDQAINEAKAQSNLLNDDRDNQPPTGYVHFLQNKYTNKREIYDRTSEQAIDDEYQYHENINWANGFAEFPNAGQPVAQPQEITQEIKEQLRRELKLDDNLTNEQKEIFFEMIFRNFKAFSLSDDDFGEYTEEMIKIDVGDSEPIALCAILGFRIEMKLRNA